MKKLSVFTSWHKTGYKKYGKHFIEGYINNWPKSVPLTIYAEDHTPEAPIDIKILDQFEKYIIKNHSENNLLFDYIQKNSNEGIEVLNLKLSSKKLIDEDLIDVISFELIKSSAKLSKGSLSSPISPIFAGNSCKM